MTVDQEQDTQSNHLTSNTVEHTEKTLFLQGHNDAVLQPDTRGRRHSLQHPMQKKKKKRKQTNRDLEEQKWNGAHYIAAPSTSDSSART